MPNASLQHWISDEVSQTNDLDKRLTHFEVLKLRETRPINDANLDLTRLCWQK